MAETCRICKDEFFRDAIDTALSCEYTAGKNPHAAVDTSLFPVRLPSVTELGVMGSGEFNNPCNRGNGTLCTLMSLLHSVKKLGAVVHVAVKDDVNPHLLLALSSAMSPGKMCVVLILDKAEDQSTKSYEIYIDLKQEYPIVLEEGGALSTITRIQRACDTMMFYWSEPAMGYSVVFNQDSNTMWAVYVPSPRGQRNSGEGTRTMQTDKSSATRAIPCFYSPPFNGSMIVMGVGGRDRVSWDDLEVEMAARCDPIVHRVYCSRAASGRCFCCQYIVNLHEEMHSGNVIKEKTIKLELTKKFRQDTVTARNSKDGRKGKDVA